MRWTTTAGALAAALSLTGAARAAEPEEVEVTSGVVTGLSCALKARDDGDLRILTACPPAEARKGLVIYDVAEQRIYQLSPKKVRTSQLESAWGGGSIDFSGVAVKVDPKTEVATVDVAEFSITKKKKPGAFKGCL